LLRKKGKELNYSSQLLTGVKKEKKGIFEEEEQETEARKEKKRRGETSLTAPLQPSNQSIKAN
jgi:hypothetical protein